MDEWKKCEVAEGKKDGEADVQRHEVEIGEKDVWIHKRNHGKRDGEDGEKKVKWKVGKLV